MGRKKKQDTEFVMPFGKFKGRTLKEVMQAEPSYLCWFTASIEGCQDIKEAIVALPGFREAQMQYYLQKHRKEMTTRNIVEDMVREMFAVEESPNQETLDSLCDQLFNAPPDAS